MESTGRDDTADVVAQHFHEEIFERQESTANSTDQTAIYHTHRNLKNWLTAEKRKHPILIQACTKTHFQIKFANAEQHVCLGRTDKNLSIWLITRPLVWKYVMNNYACLKKCFIEINLIGMN